MEAGFFILAIFIAILIRLVAGSFDGDRVEKYIRERGGKMLSKSWEPFGKGWAGEKNDRIYKVFYLDKDGNKHEAYVKTSSFSGVYFSEDKIIEYAQQKPLTSNNPASIERLELENERLKREIEVLKRNQNRGKF